MGYLKGISRLVDSPFPTKNHHDLWHDPPGSIATIPWGKDIDLEVTERTEGYQSFDLLDPNQDRTNTFFSMFLGHSWPSFTIRWHHAWGDKPIFVSDNGRSIGDGEGRYCVIQICFISLHDDQGFISNLSLRYPMASPCFAHAFAALYIFWEEY